MKFAGILCLFADHQWLKVGPFTKQCQRCQTVAQTNIGVVREAVVRPGRIGRK